MHLLSKLTNVKKVDKPFKKEETSGLVPENNQIKSKTELPIIQ